MKNKIKLKSNLDTDFLKLIAIISMFTDHIGSALFPQYPVFRWIGRIAFPIFCYCMTVGMLYTHDIKKYLMRIGIFALISQPFYVLAFNSDDFWGNITNLNIFFTLFISLLAVWGVKERKWWIFIIGLFIVSFFNFDYSMTGIVLMLIFYLFRNMPQWGAVVFILSYVPAFFGANPNEITNFVINGYPVQFSIFAVFAAPFIFINTDTGIKINRWFFYFFYPVHLFIIFLIGVIFVW